MRTRPSMLVLCALSLIACKQSTPEAPAQQQPSSQAAAPTGDAISIGATLPLTGSESRIGGFYKEGYELAFEEWNKNGGVKMGDKKVPVKLTLLDDTSTQATAASLADRPKPSPRRVAVIDQDAPRLDDLRSVPAVAGLSGGGGAAPRGDHRQAHP